MRFAGEAFAASNDPARWRSRGPFRLVKRGCTAIPDRDDSGLDTPSADELAIGGHRLDPGDPSPPLSLQRLALSMMRYPPTRSAAWRCREESPWPYCGLPPFYLISAAFVKRQLSALCRPETTALLAKVGNRRIWPIWRQSPISVIPADLPIKLDPAVLVDSELKRGIDLFAGKSEITEGCSDFREIGDSSDLP